VAGTQRLNLDFSRFSRILLFCPRKPERRERRIPGRMAPTRRRPMPGRGSNCAVVAHRSGRKDRGFDRSWWGVWPCCAKEHDTALMPPTKRGDQDNQHHPTAAAGIFFVSAQAARDKRPKYGTRVGGSAKDGRDHSGWRCPAAPWTTTRKRKRNPPEFTEHGVAVFCR